MKTLMNILINDNSPLHKNPVETYKKLRSELKRLEHVPLKELRSNNAYYGGIEPSIIANSDQIPTLWFKKAMGNVEKGVIVKEALQNEKKNELLTESELGKSFMTSRGNRPALPRDVVKNEIMPRLNEKDARKVTLQITKADREKEKKESNNIAKRR